MAKKWIGSDYPDFVINRRALVSNNDFPDGVVVILGSRNVGGEIAEESIDLILQKNGSDIRSYRNGHPGYIDPIFEETKNIKGVVLLSEFHHREDHAGTVVELTATTVLSIQSRCKYNNIPLFKICSYDKKDDEKMENWLVHEVLKK